MLGTFLFYSLPAMVLFDFGAYVVDMWVRDQVSVSKVQVVKEFDDVFPEELL